jgi:ubiquinone/menaquinone biosynthesis C-methylase UbiE
MLNRFLFAAVSLWIAGFWWCDGVAAEPSGAAPPYERRRNHDPDGIGKFYLDREIAQVMGPGGIPWLERSERQAEEQSQRLLALLELKGGETVVDFGAGSGYYTFALAKLVGPRGSVLAADIEPKMLLAIRQRAARERATNVGLVQSTALDPRLPAERIDLILLVDVYHELEFPYEVMRRLRGALKPSGRIVLVEYRQEDPAVPIKAVHKMSAAQIIAELTAAGLKHLRTLEDLPLQHVVIFGK